MCSCSNPDHIYIDIKKQAIVSCNGVGLDHIEIKSDSSNITLEGTQPIVYFNKENDVSRTSLYNEVIYNYVLKLKPNCNYQLVKYNGSDRGSFIITFKTNDSAKVTTASVLNCNVVQN